MSLVIGLVTKTSVFAVSDGLALFNNKPEGEIVKKYTYPKIRVINPGNMLLGFVGSTGIYVDTVAPLITNSDKSKITADENRVLKRKIKYIDEKLFLTSLSRQIKEINGRLSKEMLKMFIGYLDKKRNPKLVYFDQNGQAHRTKDFIALGSGAAKIESKLQKSYNRKWSDQETISFLIEMIYLGSEVPTVNFLPLVTYVNNTGIRDYTDYSINKFNNFKKEIKHEILEMVKKDIHS